MNSSSISFSNATINYATQSSDRTQITSGTDADGDHDGSRAISGTDSASISAEGLAALQSGQSAQGVSHHHHHKITDDQASKIGAEIQKKSPDLFKALDKDGDGTLSASELKDGIKQLREQAKQGAGSGVPASTDANAPAGSVADPLALIRKAFNTVLEQSSQKSPSDVTDTIPATGSSSSA